MADEDIALDFFSGLDNARYADFKADFLNGLTSQSIKAPIDLNSIYVLASQWVKLKGVGGGTGTTFATTLNKVKTPHKDTKHKKNGKGKKDGGVNNNQKKGDGTPKKPVKCFNCEGDHYIRDCPELKQNKVNDADDANMAAVMFEATTFCDLPGKRSQLLWLQTDGGFIGQPGQHQRDEAWYAASYQASKRRSNYLWGQRPTIAHEGDRIPERVLQGVCQ
jgi:hypothetical protein